MKKFIFTICIISFILIIVACSNQTISPDIPSTRSTNNLITVEGLDIQSHNFESVIKNGKTAKETADEFLRPIDNNDIDIYTYIVIEYNELLTLWKVIYCVDDHTCGGGATVEINDITGKLVNITFGE